MIETLKAIYQNKFSDKVQSDDFEHWYYFFDDNGKMFGIKKTAVTENELKLISQMFKQLEATDAVDGRNKLFDYLFGQNGEVSFKILKYYFLKFPNMTDADTEREIMNLLSESFNRRPYITKNQDIIVILCDFETDLDFNDMVKSVESDFLVNIIGYESDVYKSESPVPFYFQIDFAAFKALKETREEVLNKEQLLLFRILNHVDAELKQTVKQYVLKDYSSDSEMLNLIKMYFETNFNTTLTAKNCYIHRNTLLNKLDKFTEITGFNLHKYDAAFLVYLSIIM